MTVLTSTIERGREVLEKEANQWWTGIANMELKLGFPASELEKLYWLSSDFNMEIKEEDLKLYKTEEVTIAVIQEGKLFAKKITAYKSGRRRFVTKKDFDLLTNKTEV